MTGGASGGEGDGSSSGSTSSSPPSSNECNITIIAHSMGAAATLMYLVHAGMEGLDHGVAQAVLLSPAGYHSQVPQYARVLGPIIERFLWFMPWFHTFRFPSDVIRILAAKMVHDMKNAPATRDLLAFITSQVLGGDPSDHPFTHLHNLTYNIFAGTSTGVFRHFLQLMRARRFQSYDYGPEGNMKHYGTPHPIDFFDNYHCVNIPIHFLMGLGDTLIEPTNVIKHYTTYHKSHPDKAFLKAFPKSGHLDFTIGLTDAIISYILNVLQTSDDNDNEDDNNDNDYENDNNGGNESENDDADNDEIDGDSKKSENTSVTGKEKIVCGDKNSLNVEMEIETKNENQEENKIENKKREDQKKGKGKEKVQENMEEKTKDVEEL